MDKPASGSTQTILWTNSGHLRKSSSDSDHLPPLRWTAKHQGSWINKNSNFKPLTCWLLKVSLSGRSLNGCQNLSRNQKKALSSGRICKSSFKEICIYYFKSRLNNCSFDRVERFIHMWAYQKKITIKAKIEDTVQKLVEEGKILKNRQKSFDQSSKRRLSTIQTDERRKSPPNLNITIDHDFDGVSVFDIRNVESQHIYVDNQNFSQILGKSSHSGNHSLGTISKEKRSKVERSSGEDKISIKDKKSNHQRKISRSFMPQQI